MRHCRIGERLGVWPLTNAAKLSRPESVRKRMSLDLTRFDAVAMICGPNRFRDVRVGSAVRQPALLGYDWKASHHLRRRSTDGCLQGNRVGGAKRQRGCR